MSRDHSSILVTAAGVSLGVYYLYKWVHTRMLTKPKSLSLSASESATGVKRNTAYVRVGCPAGYSSEISSEEMKLIRPKKGNEAVYYHDYLKLDALLQAQIPKSMQTSGNFAHDEMLFIVIHQTYELWFKEIIHELNSVVVLFSRMPMPDESLGTIVGRMGRILKILKILVSQIDILDTMSPIDFLDFRDFLFPASGFESVQFRMFENKLGLLRSKRLNYHTQSYTTPLAEAHKVQVEKTEIEPNVFNLVEQWLERMPFLNCADFDFWNEYQNSVRAFLDEDISRLSSGEGNVSEKQREALLSDTEHTWQLFLKIFSEKEHQILQEQGKCRLSWRATQAALFIILYKEQPLFQVPFQLINLLQDIDQQVTTWRTKHALLVSRTLGSKLGTGGSSGFEYLKATINAHKIFADFDNLSMFLIPRSSLPKLPLSLKEMLSFHY